MLYRILLSIFSISLMVLGLNLVPKRPTTNTNNIISPQQLPPKSSIVIIAGFEAFNIQLYKKTASIIMEQVPSVNVEVLTDVDITDDPESVEEKLKSCTVLFCSLLFDYNQVQWILPKIKHIPIKFMFESAQELMSETIVGEFNMRPKEGMAAGPPPIVKKMLKQFGSAKEEDKMAGYINLLKIGPKILNLVPKGGPVGEKVKDVRTWLTVYSYWNQGTLQNIVSMLYYIIDTFQLAPTETKLAQGLLEAPNIAFYHPDLYNERGYVENGKEYVTWYERTHPWVTAGTPRIGILLYRKHVLSEQAYIGNMIKLLESQGMMPIPVFITGVEAHIIVRDIFITQHELFNPNYIHYMSGDRVLVDAIVNTIGFPLVGGPAGSMEGGRQIEVSKEILKQKNVPYIIAAPLLIQDMESWQAKGVQGLQTVILYSLPELDGAIETIVLGGLVGKDQIVILPERVRKLTSRLKSWIALNKAKPQDRKISLLVYGFPPNVGAVGTAALLNVGRSLRNVLLELLKHGYTLDSINSDSDNKKKNSDTTLSSFATLVQTDPEIGDKIIRALTVIAQNLVAKNIIIQELKSLGLDESCYVHQEVSWRELQSWMGKSMAAKVTKQWGDLESYSGIGTSKTGHFMVQGLKFGNLFIGIQPLLGLEGDPMRLLFERDLTPHPQYVAYYNWLQYDYSPHMMIHFGMHGTVEWLPGNPLGNTQETWPDYLLGNTPNLYIYACNNPSESILAKRRGYATIISHNVPPYSRAGLYNELKQIRALISEYRENTPELESSSVFADMSSSSTDSSSSSSSSSSGEGNNIGLIVPIVSLLEKTGLFSDLPFVSSYALIDEEGVTSEGSSPSQAKTPSKAISSTAMTVLSTPSISTRQGILTAEYVESLLKDSNKVKAFRADFTEYLTNLTNYLSEIENKLFSEGLYEIGASMTSSQIQGYLTAIVNETKVDTTILHLISERTLHQDSIPSMLIQAKANISTDFSLEEGLGTPESQYSIYLLHHQPHKPFTSRLKDFLTYQFYQYQYHTQYRNKVIYKEDRLQVEEKLTHMILSTLPPSIDNNEIMKAVHLAQALYINPSQELSSLMNGVSGGFIPAAPGGDLIRDGISILPTGRNIYALDPYRIPSTLAYYRGKQAAEMIIQAHREQNNGMYPETVAVTLWGLDTIKTKGESIGIILGLIGAEPILEATGRVVGFTLIPLETLQRPRIDILASLSGIFRDSFENVLDLLDTLFETTAQNDEPIHMNYIKKHTLEMKEKGIDRPYSRLFSNAPGDFGSMVNERVGSGDWEDSSELGTTWQQRNSYSYGKSGEKGANREGVLTQLLNTTDRIVQEIDCVEYGLTDIQEYFANTGAIKKAAENNRDVTSSGGTRNNKVSISVIEATEKVLKPREIEEVLRLEYRTKLLNPKWTEAMMKQGSGGAYEISGRLTTMIGWAAATDFSEKWVWDGAAEQYALNEKIANQLKEMNPEAFRNILKRLLEANGRGFWAPDDSVLSRLQELYEDVEDEIEGV